jgi:cytoskeletal protein CcmA (bactofilin family)
MFRGSPDRNPNEDIRRTGAQPVSPSHVREIPTAPPAPPRAEAAGQSDLTFVAREDQFEGSISAHRAVRVMGQVKGKIDAPSVTIDEGAKVAADITADEVVVAGQYTGNMSCRQRLEVRPSGRISGKIETMRLMLHEGAAMDGEIHMLPQTAPQEPTVRGGAATRAAGPEPAPRPVPAPGPGAEPIG